MMAGAFADETSQQYEDLFHQLKLKMVSGYKFIRSVDELLVEFMLLQLDHKKGEPSPKFNWMVAECGRRDILRTKGIRKLFERVHSLRSRGLHRLEREIPDSELFRVALELYWFFEYLDDYWEAQDKKTVIRSGKRYRRVRYGNEIRFLNVPVPRGYKAEWEEMIAQPCGDCGVARGELHLDGCDIERCPCCRGQYLGCGCDVEDDDE